MAKTFTNARDWLAHCEYLGQHPEEREEYTPRATRTAADGAHHEEDMPNRISTHDVTTRFADAIRDAAEWNRPHPSLTPLPTDDTPPEVVALDAEGEPVDPPLGREAYIAQLRDGYKRPRALATATDKPEEREMLTGREAMMATALTAWRTPRALR